MGLRVTATVTWCFALTVVGSGTAPNPGLMRIAIQNEKCFCEMFADSTQGTNSP